MNQLEATLDWLFFGDAVYTYVSWLINEEGRRSSHLAVLVSAVTTATICTATTATVSI